MKLREETPRSLTTGTSSISNAFAGVCRRRAIEFLGSADSETIGQMIAAEYVRTR